MRIKYILINIIICFCFCNTSSSSDFSHITIKLINKITGKNYIYTGKLKENFKHKNLEITVNKCIKNREFAAFIIINEKIKKRILFKAWILSKNTSISQFLHPIYSIKLINCE